MSKSNKCETCQLDIGERDKTVACDSCHVTVHASDACTNLTASELRAVVIQSRSLIYFCHDCRNAFKKVPVLLRQIEQLKNDVQTLTTDVQMVRQEVESLKQENTIMKEQLSKIAKEDSFDMEAFINEMEERRKRSKNVIIFNVSESSVINRSDRMEDEKKTVRQLFAGINNIGNVKVIRIGKFDLAKTRPLKVMLDSQEDVLNILKNRHKVSQKIPSIKIYADQTIKQRDYYKKLKAELDSFKATGDDSKITRYFNGVPKIVNKI